MDNTPEDAIAAEGKAAYNRSLGYLLKVLCLQGQEFSFNPKNHNGKGVGTFHLFTTGHVGGSLIEQPFRDRTVQEITARGGIYRTASAMTVRIQIRTLRGPESPYFVPASALGNAGFAFHPIITSYIIGFMYILEPDPIPLLTSPLKGEEAIVIFLPFKEAPPL
jgi:hypothetical protein